MNKNNVTYDRVFNNFSPFRTTENKIICIRTLKKCAAHTYEIH